MRSSHQTNTPMATACGYSDSRKSVWASSIGAVPTTAVMANGKDPPGAAAHDAVHQHEPDAEAGDLEQLELVEVQPPDVDERRQDQRPAPRVGDRAERSRRVDDREPVVGDDLGDVTVEQAAGLAQVQREVVALVVAGAVQHHGQRGGGPDHGAQGGAAEDSPPTVHHRTGGAGEQTVLTGGVAHRCSRTVRLVRPVTGARVRAGDRLAHCVRPRPWIAIRRSATLSALNMVRCHARASRASCSHASSSWAMAAYVVRI